MSGITDERLEGLRKGYKHDDNFDYRFDCRKCRQSEVDMQECLEEIDRRGKHMVILAQEVDTLTEQEESWVEENRKAREVLAEWLSPDAKLTVCVRHTKAFLDGDKP